MAIRVTKQGIKALAQRGPNILFQCRSGGCHGFEYVLEPTDCQKMQNRKCCHQMLRYGRAIDQCYICWVLKLIGKKTLWDLVLCSTNPNANSMCGCGATFSP